MGKFNIESLKGCLVEDVSTGLVAKCVRAGYTRRDIKNFEGKKVETLILPTCFINVDGREKMLIGDEFKIRVIHT